MSYADFKNLRSQWFPPKPVFKEDSIPSQVGRVFLVTGGNSGVGFELCKLLYGTGAIIYMAARSKDRAEEAISRITESLPSPKLPGRLKFLQLDLNDLNSVETAAASFSQQENKLDVLWNNAGTGVNLVEIGAKTQPGFEAMIGMHCIATLFFSQLLLPQLRAAAISSGSQTPSRVVWTSSFLAEAATPIHGLDFDCLESGSEDRTQNYAMSKVGTWMLGREWARRYGGDGVLSVIQNPGNLKAGSYANTPALTMLFIRPLLYDAKFGAYTAGISSEINFKNNGVYVIPWGRIRPDSQCPRNDLILAMKSPEEGGLGYSAKFWEWCERKWQPFL